MPNITALIASLPSPSELQFSFPKEWSQVALGSFSGAYQTGTSWTPFSDRPNIGGSIANWASSLFSYLVGGSDLVSDEYSVALNKNERVLFQTLNFRTIELSWKLVPKNALEARRIEELIKTLKILSAPYNASGKGTWDFPETFTLEISAKNNNNFVAFRTPEMACTNLTVNYTPQGFMANHHDGYPVQTILSMSFMERELAVREKIESGRII